MMNSIFQSYKTVYVHKCTNRQKIVKAIKHEYNFSLFILRQEISMKYYIRNFIMYNIINLMRTYAYIFFHGSHIFM